jgi:hypothetical protein
MAHEKYFIERHLVIVRFEVFTAVTMKNGVVALVRTNVSEEPGASFMRVTKIGELGTTQAATSNRRTLRRISSQLHF